MTSFLSFKKNLRRAGLALILFLAAVMHASAKPGEADGRVAVIDFSVHALETNRWAWANNGVADMMEMELEQRGVVTLDRDFIQAVFQEQRLAATGLTQKDYVKVASLLNAPLLVTGTVTPLADGKVRVEAGIFSVEAIETVATASAEGAFPKELPRVMAAVARTLAEKLKAPGINAAGIAPPPFAPKPEALILFYRGLNACAGGHPETAVGWLMNSAALDPDFAAPVLWEIKAYEQAGFPEFAAMRRDAAASMLKPTGGVFTNPPAARPVVAVLDTVNLSRGSLVHPAVSALAGILKRSLLDAGQVRLFAFENIGGAVAEQDLQLSRLFARQGAPRYGRWLMSDALLLSRVNDAGDGKFLIELTLLNPLTAMPLARIQRTGAMREIESLVSQAARELTADWLKRKPANPPAAVLEISSTVEPALDDLEMRPAFQNLARALARVRREPAKSESHRALANAFNGVSRWREAGLEIERCIGSLDINASDADLAFFGTHRWLHSEGGNGWFGASMKFVDPKIEAQLIEKLLAKFPSSIAVGCMYYNLARDDWSAEHWEDVRERATRSAEILEASPHDGQQWGEPAHRQILGAARYLEGYSLVKLGRPDEARLVFQRAGKLLADHFLRETTPGSFLVPYGPYVAILNGKPEIGGYGGDRFVIPPEVAEQLALAGVTVNLREEAEEMFTAAAAGGGNNAAWTDCTRRIAGLLDRVALTNEPMFISVLSVANKSLSKACARLSPINAQSLAELLAGKIFARCKIGSFADAVMIPKTRVAEAAAEVLSIYESAGLKADGWAKNNPLFGNAFPPETGFTLLTQLGWELERYTNQLQQLITRLPGKMTDVPAPVWIRLGEMYSNRKDYRVALDNYCNAISKGAEPAQCPGLSLALVETALVQHRHSADEIRRFCLELGIKNFEPDWFDWFNEGRKFQKARDWEKAIACYRNVLDFLEHPEQSGRYHLEKDSYHKVFLKWGDGLDKMDLLWPELYDQRWNSAAFCLAQCLAEAGPKEEAAQWLRRLALAVGGESVGLLDNVTWNSSNYHDEKIGVRAAEMLKELHGQLEQAR